MYYSSIARNANSLCYGTLIYTHKNIWIWFVQKMKISISCSIKDYYAQKSHWFMWLLHMYGCAACYAPTPIKATFCCCYKSDYYFMNKLEKERWWGWEVNIQTGTSNQWRQTILESTILESVQEWEEFPLFLTMK